jgi:CubicO group peptidase (beta-lactamase class C family)
MLLNHRSGLPNYLYFMSNLKWGMNEKGKWNHQYATNEDVLKMMIEKMPDPTGSPDSKFNYCNTNFVLLALIIEKITGKSYPDYLQQQIFGPLHMNHSYVFQLKDTLTATPSFTNNGRIGILIFGCHLRRQKYLYNSRDLLKMGSGTLFQFSHKYFAS